MSLISWVLNGIDVKMSVFLSSGYDDDWSDLFCYFLFI